jgi:two-component system, sensor histidine kinase YesM
MLTIFRRITSSLRGKLLLMFICLTCLPLISVGLISYQKSYNTLLQNSKSATLLLSDQVIRDMDNLFLETRKLLELEKNPSVLQFLFSQNDTYRNAKDILQTMGSYRQTYQNDNVLNVTMINTYGRGISERKGVFQVNLNSISGPPFQSLLKQTDTVLNLPSSGASALNPLDGSRYKDHYISIVSTIKQRVTHEVIGYMIIDLNDRTVQQFCDQVTIGKSGFLYIVNEAGQPIFKPATLTDNGMLPQAEVLAPLIQEVEKHSIDQTAGKPRFVFANRSQVTGWSIVGSVPLQEIVYDANSIRKLIIVSVVLSIIFAITLHYFLTKRLTLPLHILKKKMQLAASGFLEAKVTPTGKDEISDLGKSFNSMIDKIRTLLDQSIKEQRELKKADLRALQAQIHPHFLYNTLDSILWLAEAGRKEQVIQVVLALSRFFRIGLSKGKDWITVNKELEHLENYLIIQQIRYRDILDYEIDVNANIRQLPILKMILQPLVENALYHGLKNKRGKGQIRVSGHITANREIRLVVEDNGKGMTESKLEELRGELRQLQIPEKTENEVSGGFGLHNVHQRICLYYGEAYGIQLESWPTQGTKVTVTVPIRMEGDY